VMEEALFAVRLLQGSDVELLPMRSLFKAATRMSIEVGHPGYDCILSCPRDRDKLSIGDADERLLRKLKPGRQHSLVGRTLALNEAAPL
jgi:hypothetical protein